MSNAFTNFLSGAVDSFVGETQPMMKDYQHADRLYVRDTYARAPKVGFLYFVQFNINRAILNQDPLWAKNGPTTVGLLVKRIDLPKFQVLTETLNQYNRKTVVQTHIKYNPISLDFHDDNSDLTTGLWKNYYNYYYGDGVTGVNANTNANTGKSSGGVLGYLGGLFKGKGGPDSNVTVPASYLDTKYRNGDINFNYGLNNGQSIPFFSSVDIYVLHQHRFSQYTLVNPLVTEWTHDSLDQSSNEKILASKMQLAYESVLYNNGAIRKGSSSNSFVAQYYDVTPSPLSIGGVGSASLLGPGGVLAGAGDVLGSLQDGNFLGAFLQANTLVKNASQLKKGTILNEVSGLAIGTLNNVAASSNQGGVNAIGSSAQQGLIGGLGFGNNVTANAIASKLTGR
jgi:hypothetical protein